MSTIAAIVDGTDAPSDRPRETIDVRSLGPPRATETDPRDARRAPRGDGSGPAKRPRPQFLFPKLDDRGYTYEPVERDDDVVTVIWRTNGALETRDDA